MFRDLSGLGLSGALSAKLSQLSDLEDLKLQNNQFRDILPVSWRQFGALKHLNLSRNTIGGPLVYLMSIINKNLDFLGQLPHEWSSLSQLEVLDVSQNNLLGTLPPQWSALTNLK